MLLCDHQRLLSSRNCQQAVYSLKATVPSAFALRPSYILLLANCLELQKMLQYQHGALCFDRRTVYE